MNSQKIQGPPWQSINLKSNYIITKITNIRDLIRYICTKITNIRESLSGKEPNCFKRTLLDGTCALFSNGLALLYTANIFVVIFTVFCCVPISTVISLYGLHLIAAPITVE
jgi:hypothetical protein